MTVGENIKRIRKEKRLTQKQLGELCNPSISAATIRKYELSILNPKIETLQKISTALDVSITDLNDDLGMLLSRSLKYYNAITSNEKSFSNYFNQLNEEGKLKAIEMVKLLLKIPEYRI
ncbi:helix-turn-helix domain-containing protein [uncultured Eubacterium sp.]|uniref:helix-turn-helix domain-containing protein n=1 Tax=uncultured Eubacterium sp. TaxID=165185 RepID=UPI0025952488|nr:helix-turn-helix transcriptional regulator [uncultured Eubacterium sp.]